MMGPPFPSRSHFPPTRLFGRPIHTGEMPVPPKQVSLPSMFEGPPLHSFNRQITSCSSGLLFPSLQMMKDKNFGKVWISPELRTEIALKNALGKQAKKSMDPNKWMAYCKQQTKIQSLIAKAKEDQLKDSETQDMNLDKPWITDEVKNEILKKRQLRKWATESDDPDLFTQFREQRRKVVTLVQQAKAAYEKKKPAALGIPPQSRFPLAGPMHAIGGMFGSCAGSTFEGLGNQPFQRRPMLSREQQIVGVGPPGTSESSTENEEDMNMDKPWITAELKTAMTLRHTLCQQAVETSDPNLWREYRNQRKEGKQMLKKAKLAYEERTEVQVVNFAKAWLSAELESEVIRKNNLHKDATKTMDPDVWTEFHGQSTKVKLLLKKVKQIHQWMAPSVKVQEDKAWVTDELEYAVVKKKKLYQLATETMDPVLYLEYREQYKRLENLLQEARSCYYGKAGETQHYLDTDQLNELYGPLQKCGRIGCQFKAQEKIVEFHMRMAHESGLIENILQLNTPEEIEMWKEEMKKSARSGQGMLFLGGVRGYDTLDDAVALKSSMARGEREANQMFRNINDTNPLPGLPMGDSRRGTLGVTMDLQPPAVQEESKIDPLFYSHSGTSQEGDKQIVTLDASRNFSSALIRSVRNVRDNRMLNSVQSQEIASIDDKRQKQFHKPNISDQEGKKETSDRKLSPPRHRLSPVHPLRRSRSPSRRHRRRRSRSPLRRSRSPLHHHPSPLCRKSSPTECQSRLNLSEDEMGRFHGNSLQNKYRSEDRQDKGLNLGAQNSLCAAVDFITSQAKEFGQAAIPTKEVLSRAMALQVLKRAKDSDNVQIRALREQLFADLIKNEFGESFAEKFRNVSKREFSPPSRDRAMRHDGARMLQEQRKEKFRPHP